MKIGAITASLGALSFDELLGTTAELGLAPAVYLRLLRRPSTR